MRVAQAQISTLAVARVVNTRKARLLLGAIAFELLAVILLAWAIAAILYNS